MIGCTWVPRHTQLLHGQYWWYRNAAEPYAPPRPCITSDQLPLLPPFLYLARVYPATLCAKYLTRSAQPYLGSLKRVGRLNQILMLH